MIYKATITSNFNDDQNRHLGTSETTFKKRFRNYTRNFKHQKYEKRTELSKYIWSLKSQGILSTIKWRVIKRTMSKVSRILANYV